MKQLRIVGVFLVASFLMVSAVWGQGLQKHLNKGNALYKNGDLKGAVTEYRKVVEILKKGKNPPGAQQIQMNIGIIYFKQGQYAKAAEELETAVSLHKKPGKALDLKLNKILATAHYKAGNYAIRASILEALLKKYKKIDNKTRADLLAELADSYRRNEIYSKAIDYYQQALKCYKKSKDTGNQALILTAMGLSRAKLGDFDIAIKNLETALPMTEKLGKHQSTAEIYSNLGIIYWDLGEYTKSFKYLTKAKKVENKENLKRNLGADYNNEGLVFKSAGNYPKALGAVEMSVEIAREIKDEKSEAIALSNLALINRILGKNEDAMKDYRAALKIYDRVKFKEGMASCYLGLGKLYEIDRLDYQKAYEYYQKALDIYLQLGNIAYQAEALNQIGRVLKRGIDRKRTTRDLIFEDDGPVFIEMSSAKAQAESLKAYREALKLAEKVGKKEAVWSAQQGIGYALKSQGKEKEAFKYYKNAIDTVVNIRGSDSDSELMGDYLKDKEDLFTEAIEVASALYAKTKDKKYLGYQMEYQEIYKNEVMKNALMTAKPVFEDPAKAKLFTAMTQTLTKKKKLDDANSRLINAQGKKGTAKTKSQKAEQDKKKSEIKKEVKKVEARSRKLEDTFKNLLAKWKKQYPNDIGMFESAAKVDIESIQKGLSDDEALIQYFPLGDSLSMICVTKEDITAANVAITYEDLAKLIRDEFTYKQIELYGHGKCDPDSVKAWSKSHPEDKRPEKNCEPDEIKAYKDCVQLLHRLYEILILPVENRISEKQKLIIIPSKYLSYVPFSALVRSIDGSGEPQFLVYNKTVSYLRLSFFDNYTKASGKSAVLKDAKLIGVANPDHKFLKVGLGDLPGTEKEIEGVRKTIESRNLTHPDIIIREKATEDKWRKMIAEDNYTIFYFATHGVPYAEILQDSRKLEAKQKKRLKILKQSKQTGDEQRIKKYEKLIKRDSPFVKFCKDTFTNHSPLSGFLYMAYTGGEKNDGVLTLKEITELPDSSFKGARLAVLSACNTAVTYSPKIDKKIRNELEDSDISKELVESGWTPGVDQISLSDTFMKRNFQSVLGTLWFADDEAAGFIGSRFFDGLDRYLPSESLRQAQLAYLKNPPFGPDYTKVPKHPYYWAVGAMFGQ